MSTKKGLPNIFCWDFFGELFLLPVDLVDELGPKVTDNMEL